MGMTDQAHGTASCCYPENKISGARQAVLPYLGRIMEDEQDALSFNNGTFCCELQIPTARMIGSLLPDAAILTVT